MKKSHREMNTERFFGNFQDLFSQPHTKQDDMSIENLNNFNFFVDPLRRNEITKKKNHYELFV
jgi:hypothetical protein